MASNEAKLQLARQALERGLIKSNRSAAKQYSISRETLRLRQNGLPSRQDSAGPNRHLSDLEEEIIVNHILDLDVRGFPPHL